MHAGIIMLCSARLLKIWHEVILHSVLRKVVCKPQHSPGATLMPPRRRTQQHQSLNTHAQSTDGDPGLSQPSNVSFDDPHPRLPTPASLLSPTRGRSTARAKDSCIPIGVLVLPMQRRNSSHSTVPYEPAPMLQKRPKGSRSRDNAARPKAAAAHLSR